jgi:hypothetical protein
LPRDETCLAPVPTLNATRAGLKSEGLKLKWGYVDTARRTLTVEGSEHQNNGAICEVRTEPRIAAGDWSPTAGGPGNG